MTNEFISFWAVNYDAVFDILFVNLFAITTLMEVCNYNDKYPNRNNWIQKIQLLKMGNYSVENVRVG